MLQNNDLTEIVESSPTIKRMLFLFDKIDYYDKKIKELQKSADEFRKELRVLFDDAQK